MQGGVTITFGKYPNCWRDILECNMKDEGKPQQPHLLPSNPQFLGVPVRRIRENVQLPLMAVAATFAGQWLEKTIGTHSLVFLFAWTLVVFVFEACGILIVIWLVKVFKKG